jgi:uroporphyrinogen decarboxylase
MTEQQWETLLAIINGESLRPLPTGFIIDSPWLPNWVGDSILEYFFSESIWLKANMKAITTFPQIFFLPGFWSEYGMCTEPSAFGSVCTWEENDFPFAKPILKSVDEVERLEKPNPRKDGLLPFVIKRLKRLEPEIHKAGHTIRFAVARGPLNIASFLMGTTEFLMALPTEPKRVHQLLSIVTDFLVEWIMFQRECFPSIDGILVLDDIVGFIGKRDFKNFGLPYLKKIYDMDLSVKLFHNDSPCKASAPYLADIGINMLNFGIQHTLNEMKTWTDNKITLLGNIPPRDVLANGTPEDVQKTTTELIESLEDRRRIIVSCGGGMPPGVSSDNIQTVLTTVNSLTA